MNERIKELAEQAGFMLCGEEEKWNPRDVFDWSARYDEELEKFAKLIARECQDRVEHYIRDCGEIGSLPDNVIMKHFGVDDENNN